jgi:hypothetical protein
MLKEVLDLTPCNVAIIPLMDMSHPVLNDEQTFQLKSTQLKMQYEIDETFFSRKNLKKIAIKLKKINDDLDKEFLPHFKKLDSSEKQYLLIKMQEIAIPILEEMRNLHQNPNLFAEEIRRCASEYNLGD